MHCLALGCGTGASSAKHQRGPHQQYTNGLLVLVVCFLGPHRLLPLSEICPQKEGGRGRLRAAGCGLGLRCAQNPATFPFADVVGTPWGMACNAAPPRPPFFPTGTRRQRGRAGPRPIRAAWYKPLLIPVVLEINKKKGGPPPAPAFVLLAVLGGGRSGSGHVLRPYYIQ
jgi:hypothetical protein